MKRLTFKEPNGKWGVTNMTPENEPEKMYAVAAKLKDYEETGLSPDEVSDLIERTRWVPVSDGLPDDPDKSVLCIVNGHTENISFIDALQLAVYDKKEGWILEGYPEVENIEVNAWMEIPDYAEGE